MFLAVGACRGQRIRKRNTSTCYISCQGMGRALQFLGPVGSVRADGQSQSLGVPHKCLLQSWTAPSTLPGHHFVWRRSSSLVGTVRKCLPAAPSVVCRDWQPGTGTVQGDSQVGQMHVFAIANRGFGISTYSARGLCSGMRHWLVAEDPGGRTNVSVERCLLLPLFSPIQAG